MVGRETWRRSVAFVLGAVACSAFLFASVASQSEAGGGFLDRVRSGFRTLAGERRDAAPAAVIHGRSARAAALELQEIARDRNLLRLAGGNFDPLESELPKLASASEESLMEPFLGPLALRVPDELAAEPDVSYLIVQYGDVTSSVARRRNTCAVSCV